MDSSNGGLGRAMAEVFRAFTDDGSVRWGDPEGA
jgi:hypothetical protein